MKHCIKCGVEIIGRRSDAKYCSMSCSSAFNTSIYKQVNKEKVVAYKNEWRRAKNGGNRPVTWPAKIRESECLKCGKTDDLQLAHIKPLSIGGTHKYVVTFCRKHHIKYDNILREFWYELE